MNVVNQTKNIPHLTFKKNYSLVIIQDVPINMGIE